MIKDKKIILYYQGFSDLTPIIKDNPEVTDILISSIHFGKTNEIPFIHLNDWLPEDSRHNIMWSQTKLASEYGIRIGLMVGGAGGAFIELFSDFEKYYSILIKTIIKRPWITGIDLDIEENVTLDNVKMLINRIRCDFGKDFRITMAPVAYSMQHDEAGMGGFSYKDLYTSPEGKLIAWFNVQFYGAYTEEEYNLAVKNGYPAEKLVMGMLSENVVNDFGKALDTLTTLSKKKFSGTYIWEYFDAPYGMEWPILVFSAMNNIFQILAKTLLYITLRLAVSPKHIISERY